MQEIIPDRSALFDEIRGLSDELRRKGIDIGRLKITAVIMTKGSAAADLVELENAKVELEALLMRLGRRENFFRAKIDNLRWAFAAAVIACFAAGATIQKLFDPIGKSQAAIEAPEVYGPGEGRLIYEPPQKSVDAQPQQPPQKPNEPDFLNEDTVQLSGLSLLIANNDQFDRYIFNGVTGNRMYTNTYRIQDGYSFRFEGRTFEMPYGAFLFKAFDDRSNIHLPSRLGRTETGGTLADLINTVTKYRAQDEAEIKTIIATSYELSFGIKIPLAHIQIIPSHNGQITAIKYIGPDPERLVGKTTVVTGTAPDPENPERRNITASEKKNWLLVDDEGNLWFPPSAVSEQGIAVPYNALPNIQRVSYEKTFVSQGREISVRIDVPIDSVMTEQNQLFRKKEPQQFHWDENGRQTTDAEVNARLQAGEHVATESAFNLSWYVPANDFIISKLAHEITDSFPTKQEKVQAILDFLHVFNYVPDAYGEAPRTPRVSLISRGGDCEDSTILAVTLARAVGIDCIFMYMEKHAAPACDVGGPGTAISWSDGRKYELAETTGGVRTADELGRIVENRAWRVGEQPRGGSEYGKIKWVQRVGGPLVPLE